MTTPNDRPTSALQRQAANGRLLQLTRRFRTDQSGQVLPWMALLLTFVFFGLAALVVDVGRGIVAYHMLQSATDASVMAAAQMMPTAKSSSSVITTATQYSAVPGNYNASAALLPNAKMVSGSPKLECLSTVANWGVLCTSALNANAIQVSETVTLNTYFGGLIGFPHMTVTATSTAAMRGSPRQPYNVAIVLDTTASMNSTDGKTSNCSGTRISCAITGALTMVGDLSPCASGSSCGTATNGNVANPIDEVSIYTFPGLANTSSVTNDTNCPTGRGGSGTVTVAPYTFPDTNAVYYQLVGFSSDYASSNPSSNSSNQGAKSSNLQTSSTLVQALGGASCSGIQSKGGEGTYFAATIYQAQADLAAQQAARLPTQTQNVMVVLSDGDASSTGSDMAVAKGSSYNLYNTQGTYPSFFDECQQAVTAAKAATAAGTTVYTVAYGTQSSGCETDQSGYSVKNGSTTYKNANPSGLSPCETMQGIASSSDTFYSDYVTTTGCAGASGSSTSINDIFAAIAGNLSTARLIPNGTQ